jgi:hypothetical protein
LYAIGEILLVVIGILIALQIDNWNEQKKAEERIDILMGEVMDDLDSFTSYNNGSLEWYSKKQYLFNLILRDSLTYEDYTSDKYEGLFNTTITGHNPQKRRIAYDNLVDELNSVPDNYKSIVNDLNRLYSNEMNENYVVEINQLSQRNLQKWADNYKWYTYQGPNRNNSEMIDFMLNDYRFKNEVKHYASIVSGHIWVMLRDKIWAEEAYNKIARQLNKPELDPNYNLNLSVIVGNWESEHRPGRIFNIFMNNERLAYYSSDSSIVAFYRISNNLLIDDNRTFMNIIKIDDQYILESASGFIYNKVN